MTTDALARLRETCLALPEVVERPSHGAPTWFIQGRKTFATLWVDGHHDLEFAHLTVAAPAGAQANLIESDPHRFFRPPYVGHRGWVGVRIDPSVDWALVTDLCEDGYRTVAPTRLIRLLDSGDR